MNDWKATYYKQFDFWEVLSAGGDVLPTTEAEAHVMAAAREMYAAITAALHIADLWLPQGPVQPEHGGEASALHAMHAEFARALRKARGEQGCVMEYTVPLSEKAQADLSKIRELFPGCPDAVLVARALEAFVREWCPREEAL